MPKGTEFRNLTRYLGTQVDSSIFWSNQEMETIQVSVTDGEIDKMWYVYTVEYHSASK